MNATTVCLLALTLSATSAAPTPPLVRSSASGAWSDPKTWEGGAVPAAGARVQIREGHAVVYDVADDKVIRSIHVAGTLDFARDRDTKLTVDGELELMRGTFLMGLHNGC